MNQDNIANEKIWLALLFIIPLPTLSILFSLEISQGLPGNLVFVLSKILMIGIPLYWYFKLEKRDFSWSPVENKNDLLIGIGFGIGMSAAMGIAWLLLGGNIDQEGLKELLDGNGLTNPIIFGSVVIYWVFGNSLLEEIVFRWFIFEKFEVKLGSKYALFLSAAAFTLHHTIAMLYMFPVSLAILATIGVYIRGIMWSWLYLRYRSIWVPFISHVIVDVMMFTIAGIILLG